jgi:hypothetical protein
MGRRVREGELGRARGGELGTGRSYCPGGGGRRGAGRWAEVRDDLLFFPFFRFYFLIGLTSGPLSMLAHTEPAQHLQVGLTCQIRCQFAFNSRSLRITKITQEVVVFCY